MLDPRFQDPERQKRLRQQKSDALKVIMSEMLDNPSSKENQQLKDVIEFLDKVEQYVTLWELSQGAFTEPLFACIVAT